MSERAGKQSPPDSDAETRSTATSGGTASTRSMPPSGLRMPAEWEPHAGTWFSWPHNRETWPDGLEGVEHALAGAVRTLAAGETVHLNVLDESHRRRVRNLVGASDNVETHLIPTNDAWCRDHGATFVLDRHGARFAVDWGYNAWGGKYPPYDLDREVATRMAHAAGVPVLTSDWIMEGGGLEPNGAGTVITTASCMLNPNRNPGRSRREAEAELARLIGANRVIWAEGELTGDDTDGHIDNLARFVSEDTVVVPSAHGDPAHEAMFDRLADQLADGVAAEPSGRTEQELSGERITGGNSLRVVRLPHPDPVLWAGKRLPASYANFYIANASILVPTYRCETDAEAVRILSQLFPDREVVGIDCVAIIRGLGGIHCLSQTLF